MCLCVRAPCPIAGRLSRAICTSSDTIDAIMLTMIRVTPYCVDAIASCMRL